jgi:hypothetical protein
MHLPLRAARSLATFVLAIVIVVLPSSIASASPILLNFDVRLTSTGFVPEIDESDSLPVIDGVEINRANSTMADDLFSLFFDDEYVDITSDAAMTSLVYRIQGGGDDHPEDADYSTSWPAVTTLLFSNFVLDDPGSLASVSVTTNQVIGVGGGALVNGVDYEFGPTFLRLNLDSLGIFEQANQTPLGLMTFHLNFVADDPLPPAVPDAASSLTLFGMGMAALAARRRLDRRRQ